MKLFNSFLIIFFLIYIIIGCTDELDSYSIKQNDKLIINSIINPDSIFKVYITKLNTITDTSLTFINEATVIVYENGVLFDTLVNNNNGIYFSRNKTPLKGFNYNISVLYNENFYYSETNIPIPIQLDSIKILYPTGLTQNQEEISELSITFKDDESIDNYYEIYLIVRQKKYNGVGFDYYKSQMPEIKTQDLTLIDEGDLYYYNDFTTNCIWFSDKLFNGKNKTINFSFTKSFDQLHLGDDSVFVEFRSVSKSNYLFKKSIVRHMYNQNIQSSIEDPLNLLFKGTPSKMYNNISNGLGIFMGYSTNLNKVSIINQKL